MCTLSKRKCKKLGFILIPSKTSIRHKDTKCIKMVLETEMIKKYAFCYTSCFTDSSNDLELCKSLSV